MSGKNLKHPFPYREGLKTKARELRNNPTPAEKKFWNTLRRTQFYETATFNRQKPLGNYIVDFYCHRLRLVIEIDGDTHWDDKQIEYDRERTRYLEDQGLKVIRFTNQDVLRNIDGVMQVLEETIEEQKGKSP